MNLILLTPHGRSGSFLMQSLFDQHPQVFSLPTVFEYPEWKFHNSTKECIKEFVNLYPGIFDMRANYLGIPGKNVTSMFGKDGTENIIISKERFIENTNNIFKSKLSSGISRKDFIEGIHLAYSKTLGKDPKKIKYLLLHLHHYRTKCHSLALEDYSNLKYIAMVRDPRENYISLRNLFHIRTPLAKLNSNNYQLYKYTKRFKNQIENLSKISNRVDSSQIKVVDLNK